MVWECVSTHGPGARTAHTMNVLHDRFLVVIGGRRGRQRLNDIQIFDTECMCAVVVVSY